MTMTAQELVDLWAARCEAKTACEVGTSDVGDCLAGLVGRGVVRVSRDEAGQGTDLVVAHAPVGRGEDELARSIRAAAQSATKVLVVFAPNPRRLLGGGVATDRIAPVLWEIGRVREHVYLGCPAALEHAPERVRERVARTHAFVVDLSPRTPQERRRRLKQVT
jgi:hypothetical protein